MGYSQRIGEAAETTALKYLQDRQLKLVAKNFHCRHGEIDLIMLKKFELIFVEVRLRHNNDYGGSLASVTPTKQQRLIRTAMYFLSHHDEYNKHNCRFDVIGLYKERIDWIPHAFDVDLQDNFL